MLHSGQELIPSLLRTLLCGLYSVVCRLNRYLNGNTRTTPVYDLVLAGPNNRYTTPNLTVHNCVLGAGYGVGAAKFKTVAKTMAGLELTDEAAVQAIEEYRRSNPLTVAFWREHHAALSYSARRKDDTHQVQLPSGRLLTYWEPRINGREITVYQTRGDNRVYVYGGKIVENYTQALSRDILCDAWLAVDKAGLPPVTLTVHDEIVMEVRKDEADQIAKELERLMVTCSPWAEGLPLGVDLSITDRYTK